MRTVFIGGSWGVGKSPSIRQLVSSHAGSAVAPKHVEISKKLRKLALPAGTKEERKQAVQRLSQERRVELVNQAIREAQQSHLARGTQLLLLDGHYVGYNQPNKNEYYPLLRKPAPKLDLLVLVQRPAVERRNIALAKWGDETFSLEDFQACDRAQEREAKALHQQHKIPLIICHPDELGQRLAGWLRKNPSS